MHASMRPHASSVNPVIAASTEMHDCMLSTVGVARCCLQALAEMRTLELQSVTALMNGFTSTVRQQVLDMFQVSTARLQKLAWQAAYMA